MELNVIGCLLLVPLLLWPEELKKTQSVYDSHLFKHFLQTNASFYNAFIIILFHLLAHSWSEEPQKSYFSCKSYCAEESGNTPYIGCKEQSQLQFARSSSDSPAPHRVCCCFFCPLEVCNTVVRGLVSIQLCCIGRMIARSAHTSELSYCKNSLQSDLSRRLLVFIC